MKCFITSIYTAWWRGGRQLWKLWPGGWRATCCWASKLRKYERL